MQDLIAPPGRAPYGNLARGLSNAICRDTKGAPQSSPDGNSLSFFTQRLLEWRSRRQSVSEPPRSTRISDLRASLISAFRGRTRFFSSDNSNTSFFAPCHFLVVRSFLPHLDAVCTNEGCLQCQIPRLLRLGLSKLVPNTRSFIVLQRVAMIQLFSFSALCLFLCVYCPRLLDTARMIEERIRVSFVHHVAMVLERESQDRSMARAMALGRKRRRARRGRRNLS